MLKDIYLFFRKERVYFFMLLLLGAFYLFMIFEPRPLAPVRANVPSQAVSDFQDAERTFNEQASNQQGVFDEFRENEPVLARLFEFFTVFFLFAIIIGLVIDLLLLVKPGFRKRVLYRPDPPEMKVWPFSILFKTIMLFVIWGILISIVLGVFSSLFPKLGAENFYMVLHTVLLDILCVVFMVKFLKRQGSSWRELGFNIPGGHKGKEILIGVTGYLAILPLFVLVLSILIFAAGLAHYEPPPHPLVNIFIEEEKRFPLLVIFSALLGAVIGPVFEEIFFRGFCYPILKGRIGKVWAMVVSATFFASIHHTGFVFWPIFVLGIALAYLYETRRSLLAPVTLHIVHNTLFISYFFLVKQIIGVTG